MSKMQKIAVFVFALAVLAFVGYHLERAARHGAKKFELCSANGRCFYGDEVNTQNGGICASTSGGLVCGTYSIVVQH